MPGKGLAIVLLAAWVALFQLAGNSTFPHSSMFAWMYAVYTGYEDDGYCLFVPFVVLALFVWKRKVLLTVPVKPWWPAGGDSVF